MKFTVERAAFLDAISRLSKVVGNKSSLPVLEGILLSAKQGTLSMSAYNLEMGMQKEIYASCEESGEIVISANLLSNIIRRLNGPQVEIETDERLTCHIKCNEALFDIMGMAASDFPEMPSVDEGTKLTIDSEVISSMVKGTIFAVAQIERTRPILTGINISVKNNVLQFVSIDGFRLAIRREKIDECDDIEFVVAGKAVNEFVKLIDENSENIELTVGNRLISFSVNGYVYDLAGYNVNSSNYYKIRDIAMLLRATSAKFESESASITICKFLKNEPSLSSINPKFFEILSVRIQPFTLTCVPSAGTSLKSCFIFIIYLSPL